MGENLTARIQVLDQVQSGKLRDSLHHVETINDRSAPVIEEGVTVQTWDKEHFLEEVKTGAALKHVETRDASQPVIEPDVRVGSNNHMQLLSEVKAVGSHKCVLLDLKYHYDEHAASLKHVETVDKARPVLEGDVNLRKFDRNNLLDEIHSSVELRHVESPSDRSSPVVDPSIRVGSNPHFEVLSELTSATPHLKHVESASDRSSPRIQA